MTVSPLRAFEFFLCFSKWKIVQHQIVVLVSAPSTALIFRVAGIGIGSRDQNLTTPKPITQSGFLVQGLGPKPTPGGSVVDEVAALSAALQP